tara:strand:+ start:1470 stop:1985 length:516 start_codon:yes stop_codon:yes gene_type:complete
MKDLPKRIRDDKDNLKRELQKAMVAIGFKIQKNSALLFTDDDRPIAKRSRTTNEGKKGSQYRTYQVMTGTKGKRISKPFKSGNSGDNVGPRAITGNLRRSIFARLAESSEDGIEKLSITAGLKEPVPYAASLEFGDPERNILPRRYLFRGIQMTDPKPDLQKAIEVALGGI